MAISKTLKAFLDMLGVQLRARIMVGRRPIIMAMMLIVGGSLVTDYSDHRESWVQPT